MVYLVAKTDKAAAYLRRLREDQIPYVTAVTLTRLAQGSQTKIRSSLGQFFTIRNPHRIKAGVRIETARKSDFKSGAMHSVVKDIDEFMNPQAWGGTKEPSKSKYLAIPTDEFLAKGIRTSTGSIKTKFKPKQLLRAGKLKGPKRKHGRIRNPKPFVFKGHWGNAVVAVRAGRERFPLFYLYNFNPKAKIPKRWPFLDIVKRFVNREATATFSREFEKALATSRA